MKWLTTLRRKILGPNDVERRVEAAEQFGVPFQHPKFCPPFYTWGGAEGPGGCLVTHDLYKARIGDTVTVFVDDNYRHQYLLKGWSFASGDDHIVSPQQFHIEYMETLDH